MTLNGGDKPPPSSSGSISNFSGFYTLFQAFPRVRKAFASSFIIVVVFGGLVRALRDDGMKAFFSVIINKLAERFGSNPGTVAVRAPAKPHDLLLGHSGIRFNSIGVPTTELSWRKLDDAVSFDLLRNGEPVRVNLPASINQFTFDHELLADELNSIQVRAQMSDGTVIFSNTIAVKVPMRQAIEVTFPPSRALGS